METKKTIEILNSLIEIHNDRMEGYDTASKETHDAYLKSLFSGFSKTSERCKQELTNELTKLGGKPTEATKITGKMFRIWMDVKAAFTGNDRKAILDSCEFGENEALAVYQRTIEDKASELSPELQALIDRQYTLLQTDYEHVKTSRDVIV